jgi:eukaryotic-like serine/threonine-protein kinase
MRRPPSTPPELPGYTFVKHLGSGGFSDVFLYEQKLPRRRVAVKVLLTEELTAANRAAFVAEANVMAQLSAHPYIVTIYQADVAGDDRPYFVMEYCSGPSLAERYKREPFEVADALRTGVRLASAVATAHGAGILHRDIKPANVLSNDYGWPALTDFGIASAVEDAELPVMTTTGVPGAEDTGTGSTGQAVGLSVPWSPPEMFEDDPEPDVRSDIFSLAATIWTILAGQTPFEVRGRSNGTLDLMGRIERGAITPMNRDDVPASLLAVLQKGMATDRADRFASAADLARALQRVELELGYAPTTMEVPNLRVDAPERPAGGGDDETRVRSVATVEAQPAPPTAAETVVRSVAPVVAQPPRPPQSEAPSETIVRRRPAPEPEAAPEPEPVSEEPRRRRVLPWVVGGLAVVVAAGVTLGIVFGGGAAPQAGGTPTASAPPVVLDTVPTPELASPPATADGQVVFSLVNPEPQDGDQFVWRPDPAPDEGFRRVDGDVVSVPANGAPVCIQAYVLRDAKTSPNPLRACSA